MQNQTNIRLVVFDMAGTTVEDKDSVQKALQSALKKADVTVDLQETMEVMGYPKPEAIRILLERKMKDVSEVRGELIDRIHRYFVEDMIEYYRTAPEVKEKTGVSQTFRILKENNITVALDTGFSRPIADAIINRLGWAGKIDLSVTSDEVDNGRPYPDMIYKAMKLSGITDTSRVAKVGDTASDLQQGNKAGCRYVIGVTTGNFSREELQAFEHTHLIDQLPEILEILGIATEQPA
jgi:phosphonatase-like hydrolase